MRIAHATDIHWTEDVPLSRLWGKRILGTANQYLRGRRHHFPEQVQQALIDHVLTLAPDLFIITGDLTAQALPSEFHKAKRFLEPVLAAIPTVIIPGNHDVYTQGAQRDDRIAEYFSEQLRRVNGITRYRADRVSVIGLDPNRPTYINASGVLPEAQLRALADALREPQLQDDFVVLAVHYPILDHNGVIYDNNHHGLLNAQALIDVLEAAPKRPDLLIHGHEHRGYQSRLSLTGHDIVCSNCGSSGYKFMPEKGRAAGMALYTVNEGALSTDIYRHDGTTFLKHSG